MELRFCKRCRLQQPLRTKHCYDCGRCVRTHDHHCPWVGSCVGGIRPKHGLNLLSSIGVVRREQSSALLLVFAPSVCGAWCFLHGGHPRDFSLATQRGTHGGPIVYCDFLSHGTGLRIAYEIFSMHQKVSCESFHSSLSVLNLLESCIFRLRFPKNVQDCTKNE